MARFPGFAIFSKCSRYLVASALLFGLLGYSIAIAEHQRAGLVNDGSHGLFTNSQISEIHSGYPAVPKVGRLVLNPAEVRGPSTQPMPRGIWGRIGGVLLVESARPADEAEYGALSLAYDSQRADGSRLSVAYNGKLIPSGIYDWMIVPLAGAVNADVAIAVTLLDDPVAESEWAFEEARNDDQHAVFWADYDAYSANTLVGLNLVFVDAMWIDGGLEQIRRIDEKLTPSVVGYSPTTNDESSKQAFEEIQNELISEIYDTYIYTDRGQYITFTLSPSGVSFEGGPGYRFLGAKAETQERFEFLDAVAAADDNEDTTELDKIAWEGGQDLTNFFATHNKLLSQVNPNIYGTASQIGQWAAFFRFVKASHPEAWTAFMKQVATMAPEPSVETPRALVVEFSQ